MTADLEHGPMNERFDHLLGLISSERFLNREGLGNEVPFFICPYTPEESLDMAGLIRSLTAQLEKRRVRVLEINLYDLCIEILQEGGDWDDLLEMEEETSKDEIKEQLQSLLEPETHLISAIAGKMADREPDVLFLTGVGEVFPYIRSHTVLNNLHTTAGNHPTVLFFPGVYSFSPEKGSSLDLFGRFLHDGYYRAFNIYERQI